MLLFHILLRRHKTYRLFLPKAISNNSIIPKTTIAFFLKIVQHFMKH